MRRRSAAIAVLLSTSAAAQSAPIPLWDAAGTPLAAPCPTGQFPIGTTNAQGRLWKDDLLTWMRSVPQNALVIPGATSQSSGSLVPVTDRVEVTWSGGGAPAYTYGACTAHPTWSQTPTAEDQFEAVLLHAAGEEWGAHGMARFNTPASQFDMALLEDPTSCRVRVPALLHDPELTSWARLDYAGNPYYADPALRTATLLRGAIAAAMNLMILDYQWWFDGTSGGAYPCAVSLCPAQAAQAGVVISPRTGNVVPSLNAVMAPYVDHRGNPNVQVVPNEVVHDFSEVGGPISHIAYTYILAKAALPLAVRRAFEEALLTMAERISQQSTGTIMPNLGHRTIVALWLIRDAQSYWADRNYADYLYRLVADSFYQPGTVLPQGTFKDVTGFDTAYNNYNLLHLARLLAVDPTPSQAMLDAANKGFDLWAHLVFPEEIANNTTRYFSPSAYNSRTAGGAASGVFDQGVNLQRFLLGGKAGLPWSWAALQHGRLPLIVGGPVAPHIDQTCNWYDDFLGTWIPLGFRGTHHLPASALSSTPPLFPDPELGGLLSRAYSTPNFAFLYRGLNLFDAWKAGVQPAGADLLPYELNTPGYFKNFADAFFYAKPLAGGPSEAVSLVHAGPVGYATWGDDLPDGWGGGQLSALWSPDGGPFVLARRRGRNLGPNDNDKWAEWKELPLHAVWLQSTGGSLTSSARIVTPTVASRTVYSNAPATAVVNQLLGQTNGCTQGNGGNGNQAPNIQHVTACGVFPASIRGGTVLTGALDYRRDFISGPGFVTVQTKLTPTTADPLAHAFETIPLYYGQPLDIGPGYHVAGDYGIQFESVVPGQTTFSPVIDPATANLSSGYGPVANVKRVHVTRYGKTMVIEFATVQTVSLSTNFRVGYYDSYNLLIDLLQGQSSLAPTTLRYKFSL